MSNVLKSTPLYKYPADYIVNQQFWTAMGEVEPDIKFSVTQKPVIRLSVMLLFRLTTNVANSAPRSIGGESVILTYAP